MNSKIILAKGIKMDRDYNNVLSYSESNMLTLVNSNTHKVASSDNYSFIRKSKNTISTGFTYSQCLQSNYIAFQNTDYDNKWFFAWIDEIEYKSDGATEIKYTVDEWSTWFDYWEKKACFVIREHVNDDTIGLHTVPEDISVGEVMCEDVEVETAFSVFDEDTGEMNTHWIIVGTTAVPTANTDTTAPADYRDSFFSEITVRNGIVEGIGFALFYISPLANEPYQDLQRFLKRLNIDGHIADVSFIQAVSSHFVSPADVTVVEADSSDNYGTEKFEYYVFSNPSFEANYIDETVTKKHSFSNYANVKNNKLYTYPYNYLYVTNNNGSSNIYKYEDFTGTDCDFTIESVLKLGCDVRLVPYNYKTSILTESNYDESIPLSKYPTFSWASDAYTNWLTQNAVNIGTQFIETGVSVVNTENAMNPFSKIMNLIGGFYQAQLMPQIKGGNNTGDLMYVNGSQTFKFMKMHSKPEYLRMIDDYFSHFGYKILEVKEPNITGRTNWNYLEIGGSEEVGYGTAPSKSMQVINNACRKGITIWHNHANLGDYSLSNAITN